MYSLLHIIIFCVVCAELSRLSLVSYFLSSPPGLQTFITTAKKLPCPDLYDVVEGYIKISMECAEIFKLLEGDKPKETEVSWSPSLSGLDRPVPPRQVKF